MSSTGDNSNVPESPSTEIPSSVAPTPAPSNNAEIIELGRKFLIALEGKTYRCKVCKTHLALADDIVTKAFHCQSGKAYLFSNAVSITLGPHEDRMMLRGKHTVADIYCCCCRQILGWKYEAVDQESQKYKEGKFVLERAKMLDNLEDIDPHPRIGGAEDA